MVGAADFDYRISGQVLATRLQILLKARFGILEGHIGRLAFQQRSDPLLKTFTAQLQACIEVKRAQERLKSIGKDGVPIGTTTA